jgi:uncharacterized protein YcbX
MLEKAVSKETLRRIDVYRRERGLKTRRQALEALVAESLPDEHAPSAVWNETLRSREARAKGSETLISLEAMQERLERRRRGT